MESVEETLATIPEEEEEDGDEDMTMPNVKHNPAKKKKDNSSDSSNALTPTRILTQKTKQNRTRSFKP